MTDARISRSVPLDQLRQPETDVRERRPEEAIKSLAASMGDPDVGQLQDVLVHPVSDDLEAVPTSADDLHTCFSDGHPMRIVDGETRRLAAKRLGWATVDATIVPEPPEETVVAQLDANTERVDMTQAETVRALYQHYQDTEATLEDLGAKVGLSASYLSNVFGLMELPEWAVEPWRHPDHPLETGHALQVKSLLTDNTVERYSQAGDIPADEARQRAVDDAKLMVQVQAKHDLAVSEFRKRTDRKQKETIDDLASSRTTEDKRQDGRATAAEGRERAHQHNSPDPEPCLICGNPAETKIAVDVCEEDYGMLSEMQAHGETLMAQASSPAAQQQATDKAVAGTNGLAEALAAELGLPDDQAATLLEDLKDKASQAPQPD